MDELILYAKLESLKKVLARIESKRPSTLEGFKEDLDVQEIILLNLQRAVQICVDISAFITSDLDASAALTMAESFTVLCDMNVITRSTSERMKKSVGFRNLAVHEYNQINLEIVYSIATKHLQDFRLFSKEIIKWQEKANQSNNH